MRRSIQVLSIVFVWLALAVSAHADKRVALVIGNAGYQSVPRLGNPTNDAGAIGAAFKRLGFTVRSETDLGFDAMRRALKDFAGVSAGADLAVIYYAGHGMEIGGENYLVPVDAKLASDVDVPYEAISLNLALGAVEGARGTRLVILDACRNNPFVATMRVGARSRSIGRGLARVEPDVGTIVAYSAKEGTTAEDGDAEHSPFTKALLQHIEEPGIDVQFLLREVRDTVLEETNGNQEPFTYGSLPGRAVLLSPPKEPAPAPPPLPTVSDGGNEIAAEVAFWNTVGDSGDRTLLESYLTQYPNGRFVALAKILIARIDSEAAKPPHAPAVANAGPPATPPPLVASGTPAGDAAKDKAAAASLPPATAVASAHGGAGGNASGAKLPAIAPVGGTPAADAGAAAEKAGSAAPLPAGGQAGASGDAGAAPAAIGPVAALPPPSAPVEEPARRPDLVRNIQTELVRVGCAAGSADGVWGKKGRSAVEAFARYSKMSLATLDPSEDLLSTLKGYGGRACPLSCGAHYEAKGDSCVLKTCPNGMSLNGGGSCSAPPPAKQASPTVSGGKKATASASGGGCVKETQLQCEGNMQSNRGGASAFGHGGMDDSMISSYCSVPANRSCR
jgi:Caspase domain